MSAHTVRFTYEVADHLIAARLYYSVSRLRKIDRVIAWILIAFGGWQTVRFGIYWATIIWWFFAVLLWQGRALVQTIMIRMLFARNPRYRNPYEMTFDGTGVYITAPSIDAQIAWTYYTLAVENTRVIILIWGWNAYTVVPKRAFSDTRSLDAFRSFAQIKIARWVSR